MELNDLRKKIDAVDAEIVRLFEKRLAISERMAAYKKQNGMPIQDAAREEEKIAQVQSMTHTAFNRQHIKELYTLLISLSRKLQEELIKKS